ncbi:hypothetical protein L596_022782 [Steinernema carpocapsae]|uniref:Uncharacterized protein n=1 Tax=Steinernema carpocapsae TaxID=34508 RepID=A0A4U5MMT2_STECR|nr:hypothetical protein L596_022782 [Steinernema carpocapsae]
MQIVQRGAVESDSRPYRIIYSLNTTTYFTANDRLIPKVTRKLSFTGMTLIPEIVEKLILEKVRNEDLMQLEINIFHERKEFFGNLLRAIDNYNGRGVIYIDVSFMKRHIRKCNLLKTETWKVIEMPPGVEWSYVPWVCEERLRYLIVACQMVARQIRPFFVYVYRRITFD